MTWLVVVVVVIIGVACVVAPLLRDESEIK
jgi:uncharacterized protein YqgC (DUF456 family)